MSLLDVIWDGKQVGEVSVEKIGLYHLVKCRCKLPYGPIYRLSAVGEGKEVDLGILAPLNGSFQLTKRLPAKLLEGELLSFQITDGSVKQGVNFAPVDPVKPFTHLSEVSDARFTVHNDSPGVILPR